LLNEGSTRERERERELAVWAHWLHVQGTLVAKIGTLVAKWAHW